MTDSPDFVNLTAIGIRNSIPQDSFSDNAQIVGFYSQVEGGFFGFAAVEGIYFRGVDLDTNQLVEAYYIGGAAGANVGPPVSGAAGVFSFTGTANDLPGWSVGGQLTSGITGGISFSGDPTNPHVLVTTGAAISAGVSGSAGSTVLVEVNGQPIYNLGDIILNSTVGAVVEFIEGDIQTRLEAGSLSNALEFLESSPRGSVASFVTTFEDADGNTITLSISYQSLGTPGENGSVRAVERVRLTDENGNLLSDELHEQYGFLPPNQLRAVEIQDGGFSRYENCFLAGTLIEMADGSKKPIEQIASGDQVLSFAQDNTFGGLHSKTVTQTFINQVDTILNVHGLMVTPGHVVLCGTGSDKGHFKKIIDILCEDGAMVDQDGQAIRVATNCPVGSEGDQFVELSYINGKNDTELKSARIRTGTLLLRDYGISVSILDILKQQGFELLENGLVKRHGEEAKPLNWFGAPPKPEDYILRKSNLSRSDLGRLSLQDDRPHLTASLSAAT